MKIQNIVNYPKASTVMIYGDSGTGKTSLAVTAPGPILVCDVEGRLSGIASGSKLDYVVVEKPDDLRAIYAEIMTWKDPRYKTVILDSLTEIIYKLMREITDQPKRATPNMTQPEWGLMFQKVHNLIRCFRDLPRTKGVNLVVTSLAQDKADEEKTERLPDVPGKSFPYEIMGLFDAILYTFTGMKDAKVQFKLLTRDTGKVRAKIPSRTIDTILDVTEGAPNHWTLERVIDSIYEGVTRNVGATQAGDNSAEA